MNFKTLLILSLLSISFISSCNYERHQNNQLNSNNFSNPETDVLNDYSQSKIDQNEIQHETEKPPTNDYPNWLLKLYPDSLKTNYGYYIKRQRITTFKKITDSLYMCILKTEDGICSNSYLTTIKNQIELNQIEIADACDQDQSYPEYSYSTYKLIAPSEIEITKYSEYIPDHLLDENGMIKDGKHFMDFPSKKDTIIYSLTITNSGEFKKIKTN